MLRKDFATGGVVGNVVMNNSGGFGIETGEGGTIRVFAGTEVDGADQATSPLGASGASHTVPHTVPGTNI